MKRTKQALALLACLALAAGAAAAAPGSQAVLRHTGRACRRATARQPVVRVAQHRGRRAPANRHVRVAARAPKHSCQQNLRELGTAMRLYLQDHQRRIPTADRWVEALTPYLKSRGSWHCPQHSARAFSYAINRRVAGRAVADEGTWSRVLLFEGGTGRKDAAGEGQSVCSPGRHNGGNYYLFVDGRIEWRKDRPPF